MMCLSKIRELIWPLLEPESDDSHPQKITADDILANESDNIKISFELAIKNYDSENERKKSVESKSIIFIGTISLITTILISISKDFFLKDNISYDINSILFILVIILYVLYLTRTLWFSVKCLERKSYYTINYNLYNKSDKNYLKCIIAELVNTIFKNQKVINEKVDYMVMAQEYFKRAIVVLAAYPVLYVFITLVNKVNLTYVCSKLFN